MAFTAPIERFRFPEPCREAFAGKRVLITGSGRDGGIGQAFALAAAMNGAAAVGVHFHRSYRDGFDLVAKLREHGVKAFALQADVTNMRDLWASRGYVVDQMDGGGPDLIVCNSGLTEKGYRFGRALPEREEESRAERRARVRQSFIDNLEESRTVLDTKIDGFVAMTHLWAGEAVYHGRPLTMVYVSSRQAIDPGVAVPGYVIANWAVLPLPRVLRVNLGRSAELVDACCLMLPFVRTGMTEEYADNPKVFGRWQPRMLEPFEAARAVTELLARPGAELDLGSFELLVEGKPEAARLTWSQVHLDLREEALGWSAAAPLVCPPALRPGGDLSGRRGRGPSRAPRRHCRSRASRRRWMARSCARRAWMSSPDGAADSASRSPVEGRGGAGSDGADPDGAAGPPRLPPAADRNRRVRCSALRSPSSRNVASARAGSKGFDRCRRRSRWFAAKSSMLLSRWADRCSPSPSW